MIILIVRHRLEVLDATIITQEKEYSGVSVKFMGHIKQVRIPFSINLGVDDVMVPEAIVRRLKTRLSDFEELQVYTYSLESTIAEKFDAILKRMEATSRINDFRNNSFPIFQPVKMNNAKKCKI